MRSRDNKVIFVPAISNPSSEHSFFSRASIMALACNDPIAEPGQQRPDLVDQCLVHSRERRGMGGLRLLECGLQPSANLLLGSRATEQSEPRTHPSLRALWQWTPPCRRRW